MSVTVPMSCAGKMIVEFFPWRSRERLEVAQLERDRVRHHDVRRVGQLLRRKELPFRRNDLARFSRSASPALAIALCYRPVNWMSLISTALTTTPHRS